MKENNSQEEKRLLQRNAFHCSRAVKIQNKKEKYLVLFFSEESFLLTGALRHRVIVDEVDGRIEIEGFKVVHPVILVKDVVCVLYKIFNTRPESAQLNFNSNETAGFSYHFTVYSDLQQHQQYFTILN